jgi:hypothetical protein
MLLIVVTGCQVHAVNPTMELRDVWKRPRDQGVFLRDGATLASLHPQARALSARHLVVIDLPQPTVPRMTLPPAP